MSKGTPKNLSGAIENAIEEFGGVDNRSLDLQKLIRLHVKDFLGQRFMVAMLKAERGEFEPINGLRHLYESITNLTGDLL